MAKQKYTRAQNYIDNVYDGKLGNLTLSEVRTFINVYNNLSNGIKSDRTISKTVAEKFKDFGFKIEPQGIGWVIYG